MWNQHQTRTNLHTFPLFVGLDREVRMEMNDVGRNKDGLVIFADSVLSGLPPHTGKASSMEIHGSDGGLELI